MKIVLKLNLAILTLLSLVLVLPSFASAQRFIAVEHTGEIVRIEPGAVAIKVAPKEFRVADIRVVRELPGGGVLDIDPPEIRVTGRKSPSILRSDVAKGGFVEFEAQMKRKAVVSKVKLVTLITTNAFTEFGFLPPEDVVPGLGDPANDEENKKKGIKKFLIRGQIKSMAKDNRLTVLVPDQRGKEQRVVVDLEDDAEVALDLRNDIRFASIGDKITAKGDADSRNPNTFFATSIEVVSPPDAKLLEIRGKAKLDGKTDDKEKTVSEDEDPFKRKDKKAEPKITEPEIAADGPELPKDEMKDSKDGLGKRLDGKSAVADAGKASPAPITDKKGRRRRGLKGRVLRIN